MLPAVQADSSALEGFRESSSWPGIQGDPEIILAAVRQDGTCLQFADWTLRGDPDIVIPAVFNTGMALRWANEKVKNDKETVLTAVFHTGCALQFASTSLRNDKEVALEACRSDGFALQHCSESLKRDTEVVAAAMRNRIEALQFATQIDGSWACYAQSPHHVQEPELCRQARARRQEAIVSRIKAKKVQARGTEKQSEKDKAEDLVAAPETSPRPFKRTRQKSKQNPMNVRQMQRAGQQAATSLQKAGPPGKVGSAPRPLRARAAGR